MGPAVLSPRDAHYRVARGAVKPSTMRGMKRVFVAVMLVACGDPNSGDTSPIDYGTIGPLVGDAGKGSWRFGVASAATQIEDMNPNTDWYVFTEPQAQG